MVLPKLHGTTNTSDKTALVAWCRQRPTRMWQGAASGWHALTPMNSKSMVGCDGSHPSTQAHNDSGNCPGVCSVRNQSKSARRFLCVVPDALLPEANFLCPTLVENKPVGLGKDFDKVMSDAAACRNGRATQHGNSCWRMARSTSTRFATTAGPSLAFLKCHFSGPWH